MKIIYITTALESNDYKEFVKLWKRSPNPSNQNFHNKMIRSLALTHKVDVISIRPFSKKLCTVKKFPKSIKEDGNITWNYVLIKNNKISRYLSVINQYHKLYKKEVMTDCVIITDTINPLCLSAATYLGKKHKIPVIGICTDSPSNISGTKRAYTMYLTKKAQFCSGFVTLTEELNIIYNRNKKPSITIEGIVDNIDYLPIEVDRPYFYFGGSLLRRYGVYNLIEAFKSLHRDDIDLLIAGHTYHENELMQSISDCPNIKFLGTVSIDQNFAYECNAIANINPRPYSEDLDRFSIPSKTLEYLSSGVPTISIKNSKLMSKFKDEILWVNSNEVEDLKSIMNEVLNSSFEERQDFGRKAKEKVQLLYSLNQINNKVIYFISTFLNKK